MNRALLLLLATVVLKSHSEELVRYDGYKVYQLQPKNEQQIEALRLLENRYQFWSHTDVMVEPSQQADFEKTIEDLQLEKKVMIENVQNLLKPRNHSSHFNWNDYQTLHQINVWMKSLERKFPRKVKRIVGGRSYKKRNIYGVHVSFKPGNRAVFIEGGIHSREWISPATVTFIINEILYSENPEVRRVVESRDWYIFPIFNPDGYEYTFTHDRLWSKTLSPNNGSQCRGTNANRNWGYHWLDGGASTDPCDDKYAGSSAFSEIETKSLSEFITEIVPQLDAYIGFHAYSQLILIPFGHQGLEVPINNDELHRIGYLAATKISERYGTQYTVGNVPEAIYVASGSSMDWVLGVYRIKMAYTFELRDLGQYGFLLPRDQIIPTAQEAFDGLIVMIDELNSM